MTLFRSGIVENNVPFERRQISFCIPPAPPISMLGRALGRHHRPATFICCVVLHSTLRQPNIEIGGAGEGGSPTGNPKSRECYFSRNGYTRDLPLGFKFKLERSRLRRRQSRQIMTTAHASATEKTLKIKSKLNSFPSESDKNELLLRFGCALGICLRDVPQI